MAGNACAILTCDASSIIMRSNIPISKSIYSAKSLTLEIIHGNVFLSLENCVFGNFALL